MKHTASETVTKGYFNFADFVAHRNIGFGINTLFIDGVQRLGIKLKRANCDIRTDGNMVQKQRALADPGSGSQQVKLASRGRSAD